MHAAEEALLRSRSNAGLSAAYVRALGAPGEPGQTDISAGHATRCALGPVTALAAAAGAGVALMW